MVRAGNLRLVNIRPTLPAQAPNYHRRSIRLPDFDYAQEGMYYVTICSAGRAELFGQLIGDRIELSDYGRIAHNEWHRTPHIRSNVTLQDLVIMPDHMHAILTITDRRGVLHTPSSHQRLRSPSQTLGSIVRGFKAASTKKINAARDALNAEVWQRNYYEHVVRDEQDLAAIRQYIHDNPVKLMLKMSAVIESRQGVFNAPLHSRGIQT